MGQLDLLKRPRSEKKSIECIGFDHRHYDPSFRNAGRFFRGSCKKSEAAALGFGFGEAKL